VMPLLVSWSSDSAGVMYRARRPSDGVAGYHRETISSRVFTLAAQGSGREVSVSHKDVVPTGDRPVGTGKYAVCPSASPASAGVPMLPIITGWPCQRHPKTPPSGRGHPHELAGCPVSGGRSRAQATAALGAANAEDHPGADSQFG
jgi:hypothetical protein